MSHATTPRLSTPSRLGWILYALVTLLAATFIAWQALARADYLYPLWYDVLDIDTTIAVYGPRNIYRPHFETTTRAERERLFAGLVDVVQGESHLPAALLYHDAARHRLVPLLTAPEWMHLMDVARMISALNRIGWAALALWAAWTALNLWLRRIPPRAGTLLLSVGGTAAAAALLIMLIGPTRVFYAWHRWAFPPGHKWFFFYEESLMTMLMKAPDIFAPIAVTLIVLALLVFWALLALARRIKRPDSAA